MARPNDAPTPQAILMTMLGRYCLADNPAISTQGYLEVLGRIGVAEQAGRLTLSRMTERGLLERQRRGRIAYFRATELALNVVDNQERRTFRDQPGAPGPNGAWTLLCFSIPESQRKERHMLRRRLAWEGFGMLRDGVWIAPGDRDLTQMMAALPEIGVNHRIEAFTSYPKSDDIPALISRVWDLDGLAGRYRRFLAEWEVPDPAPSATDALGRELLLVTTWRQLLREAPRLPADQLPVHFPATRCERLFRTLHARYEPDAARLFAALLATHRAGS